MKYDLKGQSRSQKTTFLFKNPLFPLFCLCYWLIEETNAAEYYERPRRHFPGKRRHLPYTKTTVGENINATMGNITISLQISLFLMCNKYRLLKFTKHLKNKLNSLCEKKNSINMPSHSLRSREILVKSRGNGTAGSLVSQI